MKKNLLYLLIASFFLITSCCHDSHDSDFSLEADAGPDQNVTTGETVTLDASGSYTSTSLPLSYSWEFESVPSGSSAVLSDPDSVKPTFLADVDGIFIVNLVVSDSFDRSSIDSVTITASSDNSAPVANAGADQNVSTSSTVTLDGSGSSDADADPLSYAWSLTSVPPGSSTSFSDPSVVNPTFVADVDGSYVVQLIVNDGTVDSAPDTVTITASSDNSAPVANAGADQNVSTTSTVTLDGSGSSDADADPLSYAWSLTSVPPGSSTSFSDPSVVNPTFVADVDGLYVVQLIVNDGTVDSAPDTVTITASTANSAPVANAGADQNVSTTSTVTLDGSGSSDADSDPLSYSWSFVSVPGANTPTLSDPNVVNPTFVADVDGSYVVQLIVNDGTVDSAPDTVTITASTANSAPVANAGADQNVSTTSTVTLDGSGSSDTDADPLSYSWSFVSAPGATPTLSDPNVVNPTFVANVDGSYVVQLIVNDGTVDSAPDTVTITASTANSAPTANAGPDLNVSTTSTVTLDGSGSFDTNSDPLSYSWSFVSAPGATPTLSDPTIVDPTFVADVDGSYVVQLIVNDGTVDSAPDTVTIIATAAPPSETVTHDGLTYNSVVSPETGRIWLDRNVGATKVCTSLTDSECFGGYYQWGRGTDGHQIVNSTTTTTLASDVENAGTDFILTSSDWAAASVDTLGTVRSGLWSAIDGSSVCPDGYRVPTISELEAELLVFNSSTEILNSFLKLPTPGARSASNGTLNTAGPIGFFWSSTPSTYVSQQGASIVAFSTNWVISYEGYARGYGFSVRCIKE